jgi:hypothetical protein
MAIEDRLDCVLKEEYAMQYINVDEYYGQQIEHEYNRLYPDCDRLVYTVHLMDQNTVCTDEFQAIASRVDNTITLDDTEASSAHVWIYR